MNRLAVLTLLALATADVPITGPAGVYTVETAGPTTVTSGPGWVKISWEAEPVPTKPVEPTKPPDPGPTVPPPPTPAPTVDVQPIAQGPAWIAAVYDESKLSSYPPGQQALLQSKTIGASLKPLGITWSAWRHVDPGLGKWSADIANKPLPLVLVISGGGHTVLVYPLPADEQAMGEMAKKLRGQP